MQNGEHIEGKTGKIIICRTLNTWVWPRCQHVLLQSCLSSSKTTPISITYPSARMCNGHFKPNIPTIKLLKFPSNLFHLELFPSQLWQLQPSVYCSQNLRAIPTSLSLTCHVWSIGESYILHLQSIVRIWALLTSSTLLLTFSVLDHHRGFHWSSHPHPHRVCLQHGHKQDYFKT